MHITLYKLLPTFQVTHLEKCWTIWFIITTKQAKISNLCNLYDFRKVLINICLRLDLKLTKTMYFLY